METIPYSKQSVDADDIQSIVDTLGSAFLTQGPMVAKFETAFADYCGSRFAVAVSSGTAALTIANQAAGLIPGRQVLTTPNTFVATANSIELSGGIAKLVDIDSNDFNISITSIKMALDECKEVQGIIPVHFAGVPADMESIARFATDYDLFVIEDACHALGGTWIDSKGVENRIGDCAYSDMTIFSFHPVKQITTGEGGMITTNDPALHQKMLALRSHGISWPADPKLRKAQPWVYEMHDLSCNYRITDIQCALGLSQLRKADAWMKRRSELVARYDAGFENNGFIHPQFHPTSGSVSYHLYSAQAKDRDDLYRYLHEHKILVQVHYIPVHFHPYYQGRGYEVGDFPVCENFYRHAISLPLFPDLSDEQQDLVIALINEFYNGR